MGDRNESGDLLQQILYPREQEPFSTLIILRQKRKKMCRKGVVDSAFISDRLNSPSNVEQAFEADPQKERRRKRERFAKSSFRRSGVKRFIGKK